jgi:tetratricopeptide (TPR) repeat protein
MPSLISGYEYDIFISYRQKDNKYDGWVTEFVDNLKKELEATFKEDITVYFDINPHDGLLETHDVDASLKEKLKCLIFIPIISRTYCDPKSFAWEHEFKAFVEQASKDQYGLRVRLPNGNIASRVLPVRIHDLDIEDIKQCELFLGGVIRGVEFIYKESGFNRPLTPDDDEKINLNKTKYRNQITKVALAIKEIILGMKIEPSQVVIEKIQPRESFKEVKKEERNEVKEKTIKISKRKFLSGVAILTILIIATVFAYPKIFKRNTYEKLQSSGERISVAVMPFQNMTNDTTWGVWQEGIQNELINNLTNSEELIIRQIETIYSLLHRTDLTNYASITPSIASTISQKLDANVFILGSIKQVDSKIRINAQVIDSKTEASFKSFQIDGTAENILNITDSLSFMVKNFLVIYKLKKENLEVPDYVSTNSPEAYRYFIYGRKAYLERDFSTAINMYLQAVAIDSNFTNGFTSLSYACLNLNLYDQSKKWCLKAYEKRDKVSMLQKLSINRVYAENFETPYEAIKYTRQQLEFDDQVPGLYYTLGYYYNYLDQYYKAIPEFEKALEIYNKWDSKPSWINNYRFLGLAYHETGQFKKEKDLYRKAEEVFPDNPDLIYRQAILSLTERDTISANLYIEKYKSLRKERSESDVVIYTYLARLYSEAGVFNKAEKYYRQAWSVEPDNPLRINNLAYFLINNERNIEEGLELANRALGLIPDDYVSLHAKGWGLYKQGKYKEAFELLQNSWDLRRKQAVYNHEAFLHLEAAKKAVAGLK